VAIHHPSGVSEAAGLLAALWRRGIPTEIHSNGEAPPAERERDLVSTAGLDRIVRVDRENGAIVVEAGVTVAAIRAAAHAIGHWCPALRWLSPAETIGAAVAGGHGRRSRRFGAVADYLLGTRFACPSVELVRHGGLAIKNATGYNLTAMVAGSRGQLGVVLEVNLRLVPLPPNRRVQQYRVQRSDLWRVALASAENSAGPGEALPRRVASAVEAALATFAEAGYLLVETDSADEHAHLDRSVCRFGGEPVVTDWPPDWVDGCAVIRRLACAPAAVVGVAERLAETSSRERESGWLLVEATGGALETNLPGAGRDARGVLAPGSTAGSDSLRSTLKRAFDPDGLLVAEVLPGSNGLAP
jgi:FAD/FMN-containing dehydrogenase